MWGWAKLVIISYNLLTNNMMDARTCVSKATVSTFKVLKCCVIQNSENYSAFLWWTVFVKCQIKDTPYNMIFILSYNETKLRMRNVTSNFNLDISLYYTTNIVFNTALTEWRPRNSFSLYPTYLHNLCA